MTRDEVLTFLTTEATRVEWAASGCAWYIFGSVRRSSELPADIDLLILCADEGKIEIVRNELRDACSRLPLHLFLVTRGEEEELGFINGQDCLLIYPT
jgi:hypothetical protein